MSYVTVILLLAALSMFVWLAALSRNIKSFQFQISIFIVIWVLGQVVGILQDSGIIVLSPLLGDISLEIHVISLVFLSIMIWLRFYYSERSGRRMIEDLDATLR
jgi:D-alanyl-lipoteichoic acid acyltransferase DltB (MBOAT superfamily)